MDLYKERSLSVEKLKSAGKRLRTHRLFQDPFILFLIITSLVVVTVFIIYPLFCILKTSIYYMLRERMTSMMMPSLSATMLPVASSKM